MRGWARGCRPAGGGEAAARFGGALAIALSLLLLPTSVRAGGPVAVAFVGDDPTGASARRGVEQALEVLGLARRPAAQVARKAGAPLAALAEACSGRIACIDGLARSVGSEIWLVDVVRDLYVTQVVLYRGLPGGGGARAQRTVFEDAEVGVAAFGLALDLSGRAGVGTLEVRSDPSGAAVRVAGREVGQTPLEGLRVPAGALRVELSSPGFVKKSLLVAVRPGVRTEVAATLDVDVGGIPLADLSGEAPGAAPSAASPALAAASPERAVSEVEGEGEAAPDLSPERAARLVVPPLEAPPGPRARGRVRLPTYLTFGLGALAVGGGAAFGWGARERMRRARAAPVQLDAYLLDREARRSALLANVFYAVGAAALGSATYLLLRDL